MTDTHVRRPFLLALAAALLALTITSTTGAVLVYAVAIPFLHPVVFAPVWGIALVITIIVTAAIQVSDR